MAYKQEDGVGAWLADVFVEEDLVALFRFGVLNEVAGAAGEAVGAGSDCAADK